MERLRRSLISDPSRYPSVTVGSPAPMPERVLQFGEGNFLRAFVDWHFNELINAGLFHGSIVVVQPLPQGMVRQLNEQDGLYTVVQRGYHDGTLVERMDLITAIRRGIDPYTEYAEYLRCAKNPDLRYIISNTTESGIEYVRQDMPDAVCPASYPAKVAALLYERFRAFSGDPSKGMILIPCELIERNGDMLKEAVLRHAADWQYGEQCTQWIERNNYFCNTLVDRIVPGYPKEEAAALCEKFGYHDSLIVACEIFHKWVIQGDPVVRQELPFDKIGLNVVWTDDITPHRTLKVRILNGAHTTFTIPAILSGKEFVKETMDDPVLGLFVRSCITEEILPTLKFDKAEKEKFAAAVVERFKNPFIRHALLSITLNSISKYKVRVLPSVLEYIAIHSSVPQHLAFGLAAILRFYRPVEKNEKGYMGIYRGIRYPLSDAADVIEFCDTAWKTYPGNAVGVTRIFLSHEEFWGQDLTAVPDLVKTVAGMVQNIDNNSVTEILSAPRKNGWATKILMHQNF